MSGLILNTRMRNFDVPPKVMQALRDANTEELMAEIGEYVLSETLLNFENEQTPDGEAWEESIRAKEQGGKTLQDRGHLRDSYTYEPSSTEVVIGSNLIYAAIHHYGGTIRARNAEYLQFKIGDRFVRVKEVEIPARPALGINDDMHAEIGDQVLEFYRSIAA